MKFNIYFVVLGSCLVAATANIVLSSDFKENDIDNQFVASDVAESIPDVELFWKSSYSLKAIIHKALSIIRGVKCTIREVLEVKEACLKFVNDIEKCGKDISDNVKAIIKMCKKIISLCNDILHVNKKICGNSEKPEISDKSKTPRKCLKKLYKKTVELVNIIDETTTLMQQITKLPDEASKCVTTAVKDLECVLIEFPSKIDICSK